MGKCSEGYSDSTADMQGSRLRELEKENERLRAELESFYDGLRVSGKERTELEAEKTRFRSTVIYLENLQKEISIELYEAKKALASSEFKRLKLKMVLKDHHNWHLQSKEVVYENNFSYDLAAEYCDSSLCDKTLEALAVNEEG